MEGRDSPGPFSESFCVPVAICGQKGLLTLGRRCRTWAREAGSTLAGCGGKAARRTDWPVGVGCMERAQLRTGRPKVAREVAEHSMDSQKAPFRHRYFVPRQRQRVYRFRLRAPALRPTSSVAVPIAPPPPPPRLRASPPSSFASIIASASALPRSTRPAPQRPHRSSASAPLRSASGFRTCAPVPGPWVAP